MKIRCTRRDVWWVVMQTRHGEVFTYSFVWPMVIYWLQDQLGLPLPPGVLSYLRNRGWRKL